MNKLPLASPDSNDSWNVVQEALNKHVGNAKEIMKHATQVHRQGKHAHNNFDKHTTAPDQIESSYTSCELCNQPNGAISQGLIPPTSIGEKKSE